MNEYSIIRIYSSEKARYEGRELPQAVEAYVRSLKIAARCVVLRGIGGCYESGEAASAKIVDLSYDLPLIIEIVLPVADEARVLARLDEMVVDGVVATVRAAASVHRTRASLLPKNLRVRDVMTSDPVCAHADFSVRAAAELLIDRDLKALPVLGPEKRCIGIITQGDLVSRAGMPVRLGLLGLLPEPEREAWLRSCEDLRCDEVMTGAPRLVEAGAKLVDAMRTMNREGRKRLPVVDEGGAVVGILSRIDILRAIAASRPEASPSAEGSADVGYARYVEELKDRDELSIGESTTLKAAVDRLVTAGGQRAAVVDAEGRLAGLVTDGMLLQALGGQVGGRVPLGLGKRARLAARPVSGIMERDLKVATEKMTIYEALGLMTEYGLKRIPVVDGDGIFRGMIRRDSILLAFSRLWDAEA